MSRRALLALPLVFGALAAAAAWRLLGWPSPTPAGKPADYVGEKVCAECHAPEAAAWSGSDHAAAMQPAREGAVLGDFDGARFEYAGVTSRFQRRDGRCFVGTDGPDGRVQEFEVSHAFGVRPLQQYLIPLADGRVQALGIAWDSRPREQGGERWFHLYPGERLDHRDPLHWTARAQNWNFMCAECHVTNVRKGYDAIRDEYRTTFSELGVSCEACHGPGSNHVAWARDRSARAAGGAAAAGDTMGLVVRFREVPEIETCARCHSRRSVLSEDFVPGRPLLDTHLPALLDEGLYFADGQIRDEVYEYGSFLQSRMHAAGVTCKDCHDPHRVERPAVPDRSCEKCHAPARFASPSHHFHRPGSKGASCVECHMAARTYMVVDPRRDHSFRVPRPDLTQRIGVPNACTGCHRDRAPEWASRAIERWWGPSRASLRPHYGETLDAGRHRRPGAEEALVRLVGDTSQPAIARATAVSLLRELLSPASLPAVERALSDPDPLVRTAAAGALEAAGPETRAARLAPLLADPVRAVRLEAARLLAGAPPQAVPAGALPALSAAVAEYERAQRLNADTAAGRMNLAGLRLAQGNLEEARRETEAALRLEPAFVPASINLADVLRRLGRDDEGERVLRAALERSPASAEAHHALGLRLVRARRLEGALAELRRAAELDPAAPRYVYVYAVALRDFGRHVEALAQARALLRLAPADPAAQALLRELETEG